jgi:hypothetical protein
MSELTLETPWTRPAIRRAPVESLELLQRCEEYGIRLGEPRIVSTSFGSRIVRTIVPTGTFWRNWDRYFWTFKRLGVVVSREDENWSTRLWTRPPKARATSYCREEERNRFESAGNVIRPLRWGRSD